MQSQTLWVCWVISNHEGIGATHLQEGYAGVQCKDLTTSQEKADKTQSPTIRTESLFLTCLINAMERCHIISCDIPGAFMQVDIDELIHLKLVRELLISL